MRLPAVASIALLVGLVFAGCAGTPDGDDSLSWARTDCQAPTQLPAVAHPVAVLETSMGTIRAELHLEQVPITVQNFIDLAESGYYDDTTFHRIITNFMMQGGDPQGTGRGGEAAGGGNIPDEFHHRLRHDGKGVLSMANAGPNTGGSQFFITFGPTPHLDDRHSVFGQVVEGMEVLDAVNNDAGSSQGTPRQPVDLQSVTIEYPDVVTTQHLGLDVWAYDDTNPAQAGVAKTAFIAVVENLSDRRIPVCLEITGSGAEGAIEPEQVEFELPARQRTAVVVEGRLLGDSPGTLTLTAQSVGFDASLDLHLEPARLGERVREGQQLTGHYLGVTVDGRVFDTSVQAIADRVRDEGLGYATFQHRGSYSSFSFTPGSGVIQGFTDLATTLNEGGVGAARVAPQDAYGTSGQNPLAGRTLIFQLEALSVS